MVNLLFYLCAACTLLAAAGVVIARNPVMSVLSLLGSFFFLSMSYLLTGFQFIAAIQILVYGGAVMVLFLFVVMLLNLGDPDAAGDQEPLPGKPVRALGIGVACLIAVAGFAAALSGGLAQPTQAFVLPPEGLDPLGPMSEQLFTRYSLPFEAASVLLLATAVGVMVLAKRQRTLARVEDIPQSGARQEEAA